MSYLTAEISSMTPIRSRDWWKREFVKMIFDHLGGAGTYSFCVHPYLGNSLPSLFPFVQVFRKANIRKDHFNSSFISKHMYGEVGWVSGVY